MYEQRREPGTWAEPPPVTLVGRLDSRRQHQEREREHLDPTAAPVTPVPGRSRLPNPGWTEDINTVAFTTAKIQLFQDANADNVFQSNEPVPPANMHVQPTDVERLSA